MRVLKLQKRLKVSILFLHVKSKKLVTKKYELRGPKMHNPNESMIYQNVSYIFFKLFSNVIFSQTSTIFEAHSQERSGLKKIKIPMDTYA